MDLRTLRQRFRDDAQLRRVRDVIQLRLADDRDQDECRTLMRFWWQLGMPYTEVRDSELDAHVSSAKRAILDRLLAALERGDVAIDRWIQEAEVTLPVIEDRGHRGGSVPPRPDATQPLRLHPASAPRRKLRGSDVIFATSAAPQRPSHWTCGRAPGGTSGTTTQTGEVGATDPGAIASSISGRSARSFGRSTKSATGSRRRSSAGC